MTKNRALVAVPAAMLSVGLVAGCGGHSKTASSATGAAKSAGSSASAAAGGSSAGASSDPSASCPTKNTRSFAKTRFVTDVGLAAGTFHRYIYKPYQAGTLKKGANGRVKALVKAGATAALDYKLISNAKKNVQANPTLCKAVAAPLQKAEDKLKDAKSKIKSGDLSSVNDINTSMSGIMSGAKSKGTSITETTDESKQSQG